MRFCSRFTQSRVGTPSLTFYSLFYYTADGRCNIGFQLVDGQRFWLVDCVLNETSEEEIHRAQVRPSWPQLFRNWVVLEKRLRKIKRFSCNVCCNIALLEPRITFVWYHQGNEVVNHFSVSFCIHWRVKPQASNNSSSRYSTLFTDFRTVQKRTLQSSVPGSQLTNIDYSVYSHNALNKTRLQTKTTLCREWRRNDQRNVEINDRVNTRGRIRRRPQWVYESYFIRILYRCPTYATVRNVELLSGSTQR